MTADQHRAALAAELSALRAKVIRFFIGVIAATVATIVAAYLNQPLFIVIGLCALAARLALPVIPAGCSPHAVADLALIVETTMRARAAGEAPLRHLTLLIAEQGYLLRIQAEEFRRLFNEKLHSYPPEALLARAMQLNANQVSRIVYDDQTNGSAANGMPGRDQ